MSRFITGFSEARPVKFNQKLNLDLPLVSLRQALQPIEPYITKVQDHAAIALEHCHYPSEHDLSRDESAAIYLYSMETKPDVFYKLLNRILRSCNAAAVEPWRSYLKILTMGLGKLPSLQAAIWRGGPAEEANLFKKGQRLYWPSLTSCSLSLSITKNFMEPSGTLFMIEATDSKDISKYTRYPKEEETLLPPGTNLIVVSNSLELHAGLQVVHLKQISSAAVILIGISGPSGCSRHVYADHLVQRLNSPFHPLLLKSFWRIKIEVKHPKFGSISSRELPECHDIEAFAAALREIRVNAQVESDYLKRREDVPLKLPMIIVVDGFLIFGLTDEITSMFDIRIFIEADQKACRLGRYRRDYKISSDVTNERAVIPSQWQQWYDEDVWYEYLKRREGQIKHAGRVFQDIHGDERDFPARDQYIDECLRRISQ